MKEHEISLSVFAHLGVSLTDEKTLISRSDAFIIEEEARVDAPVQG